MGVREGCVEKAPREVVAVDTRKSGEKVGVILEDMKRKGGIVKGMMEKIMNIGEKKNLLKHYEV